METTNQNKKEQFEQISRNLSEKDFLFIRLKYEGKTLKKISEITGVSYQSVRSLFSRSGRLFEPYQAYAFQENDILCNEARIGLSRAVNRAVAVVAGLLGHNDPRVRLSGAREILARAIGKEVVLVNDYKSSPARDILVGAGIIEEDYDPR